MNAWRQLLGLALLLGACGGSSGAERGETSTQRASAGAELRSGAVMPQPQTSPGGPNVRERAPEPVAMRRAATPDLAVELHGPGSIGPVHEGELDAVGLTVDVQNRSRQPIAIDPATALVEVFRHGHLVTGCAARVPLKLPATLAPGVVHRVELPAPCPLPDEGDYEVVSTVVVGDEDPEVVSPAEAHRADQVDLHIDAELPPAGAQAMPVAPVHAPPASETEVPVSADRLPEETGPGGHSRPSVP